MEVGVGGASGAVEVQKRQGSADSSGGVVRAVTMQAVKVAKITTATRGGGGGGWAERAITLAHAADGCRRGGWADG